VWDAKARLLGVSLLTLLGASREAIAAYGSGGFTSYSIERLQKQLAAWAAAGLRMVKMKVGRDEVRDRERVTRAGGAIGPDVELFVDANGAYDVVQATRQAAAFAHLDVRWFEEPVSSDDLAGLRLMRERAPAGMAIAAGEYGYDADNTSSSGAASSGDGASGTSVPS
jgi:L-alanine-DL-glutamate epimerase-like enolase superfamily enzyme